MEKIRDFFYLYLFEVLVKLMVIAATLAIVLIGILGIENTKEVEKPLYESYDCVIDTVTITDGTLSCVIKDE